MYVYVCKCERENTGANLGPSAILWVSHVEQAQQVLQPPPVAGLACKGPAHHHEAVAYHHHVVCLHHFLIEIFHRLNVQHLAHVLEGLLEAAAVGRGHGDPGKEIAGDAMKERHVGSQELPTR